MATKITTPTAVSILYLDDNSKDIQHFEYKIQAFNSEQKNLGSSIRISCKTTTSHVEFWRYAEALDEYNCIMVDHNMTEQKGIQLLVSISEGGQDGNRCFGLYTAAGGLDPETANKCMRLGFLLLDKVDEFSVTVSKILDKLKIQPARNPLQRIYSKLTEDLLSDLENLKRSDPEFTVTFNGVNYGPLQLIDEIKRKTEFGIQYVESYIDGLKFFNKH